MKLSLKFAVVTLYMCTWLNVMKKQSISGFLLADIDECALPTGGHICSFRCINIPGSFQCTCPSTGYRLAPNARNCQGEFNSFREMKLDCGLLKISSKLLHLIKCLSYGIMVKAVNISLKSEETSIL